jgi:MFS family permease
MRNDTVSAPQPATRSRSALHILALTLFIDMLGFGLILPLLPVYISHYGGTARIGGLLLASFSTMQFVFAPIWGRISDARGRRPIILLGLSGSAVSYFMFGAAPNLAVLFVARVASGILTAASLPTSQAYIADVTPPEKRAAGMGMLGAAFGLGFAFGPVVSGVLSKHALFGITPLAMPAYFAALLAACNWLWALFMLPESHLDRQPTAHSDRGLAAFHAVGRALRSPSLGPLILVYAFQTFAFTAVESCYSWLVILRFRPLLAHRAVEAWAGVARLPLERVPQDIVKILPPGSSWQALARLPFQALPHPLQQRMIETASTQATTTIFAIVGLTVLFVQIAVMRGMARHLGEKQLVVFGVTLLAGTLVCTALAQQLWEIYLTSGLVAIGSGVMNPSLTALITHAAGPQERGMVSGAQQGLGSLARIVAPPINNSLIMSNTAIPFLSSAVLMAVAAVLSLRMPTMQALDQRRERSVSAGPNVVGQQLREG